MSEQEYGELNGHAISIIMRELVRRAIGRIYARRVAFEANTKMGYDGKLDEVFTTADTAAQRAYVKSLLECFPEYGIVAEEDGLSVPCTHPNLDIWFAVDPLDGTKAFTRRQSHGVGSMIALVCNGEVIAAYIGDTNTNEVFGFRPDSGKVHRISDYDTIERLSEIDFKPLSEHRVMLHDEAEMHSSAVQWLVRRSNRIFRGQEVTGGSIGMKAARLWTGEIGAMIMHPGWQTPWDLIPVLGISQKLGFVTISIDPETGEWQVVELPIQKTKFKTDRELMLIRESHLVELPTRFA